MKVLSPYPVLDNRPIDQWKVTELKEELKRRKLTIKGLKEDLIKRLDEAIRSESESAEGNADNGFAGTPESVVQTVDTGSLLPVSDTTGDMMDHGNNRNEVDVGMDKAHDDDTTVSLGDRKGQEGEVTVGTDSVRDEGMAVHATSTETSITANESVVSEIAVDVQESQNNESPNGRGDLKSQLENEEIKPPQENIELNSSDPNNQVSEVSTVLGFQVKSDSISSDCVPINETNELKDNTIADNVKLELDVKPEMVQPSSSNVLPDVNKLHLMDVEELHENKVLVEEGDDNTATNAEMSKKNDSADMVSSEKLNLDRSSGDDSMEDDALESKQIDSKYTSDEVGDRSEKNDVPVKEEAPVDGMQDAIHVDKKDIHDENKNAPAAPTVKRKVPDKEIVGNNETSKRQRRWNSENLKVPESQSNIASSTTPKDMFPGTTLKRNFPRSDSTASEDAPKQRVVPPSPKSPTISLRIDRFLRPFTLKALQELLGKTGTVTSFWMDHIKTHCYVTYSSVEEAIETRNAVYNLQWPPNGGRLLVAEFVDPQEVGIRAEAPPQSSATPVGTRPTTPPAPPTLQPQPSPRQPVQRQQLPPPPSLPPPPPFSNPAPTRERLPLPPPTLPPEKVDSTIVTLDDLFRKTKATPRIYYLPLSDEQIAVKLKAQGKSTKQSAGVACRKERFQSSWCGRSRFIDGFEFFRRRHGFGLRPSFMLGLELRIPPPQEIEISLSGWMDTTMVSPWLLLSLNCQYLTFLTDNVLEGMILASAIFS